MESFARLGEQANKNLNFVNLNLNYNFNTKNSKENLMFTLFLADLQGPLSFYTAVENKTILYNIHFGFGGIFHPPCWPLWVLYIDTFICIHVSVPSCIDAICNVHE